MANNGATLVSTEPIFHGDLPYRRGTLAEDFIPRVNNWGTANGWTAVQKTAHCQNFLRDGAAHYFNYTLECQSPDDFAAIKDDNNWDVFERVFKKKYFTIRTTMDLSADWSKMRQSQGETACNFAGRVGGLMIQYSNLLPPVALVQADLDPLADPIDATQATQNQARVLMAAIEALVTAQYKKAQRNAYYDLGYKILATGMKNPTLVAKVRAQERAGKPFGDIMDFLEHEEANMGTAAKPADNEPPKSHIAGGNKVAEVSAEDNGEVDEDGLTYSDHIAAINQKFRKGPKGNGKGKKKPNNKGKGGNGAPVQQQQQNGYKPQQQQQAPQQQQQQYRGARPRGDGPPGTCHMCKQPGHWLRDCPKAQEFADFKGQRNDQAQALVVEQPQQRGDFYQNYQAYANRKRGEVSAVFTGPAYEAFKSGKGQAEMS